MTMDVQGIPGELRIRIEILYGTWVRRPGSRFKGMQSCHVFSFFRVKRNSSFDIKASETISGAG